MENVKAARFCTEISIYDNETGKDIVVEGLNINSVYGVIQALESAIKKMKEI